MPSGQIPKIFGTIYNAPVKTVEVTDLVTRSADRNGLLHVKLKRKLEYHGHVFFETVRPVSLDRLLRFLKENNPLYLNVVVKTEIIPPHFSLSNVFDSSCEQSMNGDFVVNNVVHVQEMVKDINDAIPIFIDDKKETIEEAASYLDDYRSIANETCLVSLNPQTSVDNDCINIAPGEGKQPNSILSDQFCEELAFPFLFPAGMFRYRVQRDVKLSPVKYFHQRLLYYSQKFAAESDFFFVRNILQNVGLQQQINIAIRKVTGALNAGSFKSVKFRETVRDFAASNQALSFTTTIKGTPAYWKMFKSEILAMMKHIGIPTFFLILSCADLR